MVETLWFAYGRYRFTRKQVQWVLDNASLFDAGIRWPPRPPTGYFDQPRLGKPQPNATALFCQPIDVWAEICLRLKECGFDGADCRDYYLGRVTMSHLCRLYRCDEDRVKSLFNGVIGYIASGPCKRWMPCPLTCDDEMACARPHRQPVTYLEWKGHKKRIVNISDNRDWHR